MRIELPEFCLVVLVGPTGAGKTTLATRHFEASSIVSMEAPHTTSNGVASDETPASLLKAVEERLGRRLLAVVDAPNVSSEARTALVRLAKAQLCQAVALVLDLPRRTCLAWNAQRQAYVAPEERVRLEHAELEHSRGRIDREGFAAVHRIASAEDLAALQVCFAPLPCDRRSLQGPFDIIGDVHGCCDELEELLDRLGYAYDGARGAYVHPRGRTAVFVGDLIDRGPRIVDAYRLVRSMVEAGSAQCVPGNHDMKLARRVRGRDVEITHGLDKSLAEFDALPLEPSAQAGFANELAAFFEALPSHLVLDEGRLVVAHAGLKEPMHNREAPSVRAFALYAGASGEADDYGLPLREDWAEEYDGDAAVVYGHTPVADPVWRGNTINIDTGCVFGGSLTAVRYPERSLCSIRAARVYDPPKRPFLPEHFERGPERPGRDVPLLGVAELIGKRVVNTRLRPRITLREENASVALEVLTRFSLGPEWLIYLPPSMPPPEPPASPEWLEHPFEALDSYAAQGVERVAVHTEGWGRRVVAICCRDETVAARRFGASSASLGVVFDAAGRPALGEGGDALAFAERLRAAVKAAALFEALETDWLAIEGVLSPTRRGRTGGTNQGLVRPHPAHPDAEMALVEEIAALRHCAPLRDLLARREAEARRLKAYAAALEVRDKASGDEVRFAPVAILAGEGGVHALEPWEWHVTMCSRLCVADGAMFARTPYVALSPAPGEDRGPVTRLWEEACARGAYAAIVRPEELVARHANGLVAPAVRCRTPDALRVLLGPAHDDEAQRAETKRRGISMKRSQSIRQFALGIEALERFRRHEPLHRIHECIFAVLSLAAEPLDPRL